MSAGLHITSVVRAAPLLLVGAAVMMLSSFSCRREAESARTVSQHTSVPPTSRTLAPEFHRGVNHAHVHRRGHGYGSAMSAAELDSLHHLGVDAVAITPFGFQESAGADRLVGFPDDSSTRRRGDPSMVAADLIAETASAHRLGMRVVLKPHLWSHDFWNGDAWHGTVDQSTPEAHATWWNSYRAFALHYARVAESAHMEMYCIGTELVKMSTRYPDEWRTLIRDIRQVYHGKLSYAAHWEREFDSIAFWGDLDYIGITAYFPLAVTDSATVDQLVAAWAPHRERIARLAQRTGKPVLFLEAGYRPATGTFQQPWLYKGGQFDPSSQMRAYEALFRAFADQPWWHGVYLWKTFTDPARASSYGEDMDFCFRGLPAEQVVREWYTGKEGRTRIEE